MTPVVLTLFCKSFTDLLPLGHYFTPFERMVIVLSASEFGLYGSLQQLLLILTSHFMDSMIGTWSLCSCFIEPSLGETKIEEQQCCLC